MYASEVHTSAPADHTTIEMTPEDSKEYAEFQQFKRFQSFFSQSPNQLSTPHHTPSPVLMKPTRSHCELNTTTEEAEFHGFLSQRFPHTANPAPLGLCAFGVTTFVLSMYNAGAFVPSMGANGVVLGLALAYGGLIQLIAGIQEWYQGNTFGSLAFSSYGGFWMSLAAIRSQDLNFLADYSGDNADQLRNAMGVWFMAWTIFTFMMLIAAHRTSIALVALFASLTITFILLTVAEFTSHVYTHQAGGAFGILTSAIAFYAAFAGLLNRKTQNSLFTWPVGDLRKMWPTEEELAQQQGKRI